MGTLSKAEQKQNHQIIIRTIWPVSNLDCGDPETWDSVCVPEADTGGEQDGLVNR